MDYILVICVRLRSRCRKIALGVHPAARDYRLGRPA